MNPEWELHSTTGEVDNAGCRVYILRPAEDRLNNWLAVYQEISGSRFWCFWRKGGEFASVVPLLGVDTLDEAKAVAIALHRMED